MNEILYDDKLAGTITRERYKTKHDNFIKDVETLDLAMASFDSSAAERKRRGMHMI